MTPKGLDLIDRAVEATGTDLTDLVVAHAAAAAQRVPADGDEFVLGASTLAAWEEINARPARDLPGLRRLMQRPSPFNE
jgi:uncharacterized protein (DUF1778 family)